MSQFVNDLIDLGDPEEDPTPVLGQPNVSTVRRVDDPSAPRTGQEIFATQQQFNVGGLDAREVIEQAAAQFRQAGQRGVLRLMVGGRTEYRPLDNVRQLFGVIDQGREATLGGSDRDTADILVRDAYNAEIVPVERVGPNQPEARGEFFPYVISERTEGQLKQCGVDLTPYQIYSPTSMKAKYEEALVHCFWRALSQVLPDEGAKLLTAFPVAQLCAQPCKRRFLNQVAELYKIRIRVVSRDQAESKSRGSVVGKEGPEVFLGLYKGHFFANRTLPLTGNVKLMLKKDLDEPPKMRNNGYYTDGRTPTITVFNLLCHLNDAGCFGPIPQDILQGLGLGRVVGSDRLGNASKNPFCEEDYIPEPEVGKPPKPKPANKFTDVWYADFETITLADGAQEPYLACAVKRGGGADIRASDWPNLSLCRREEGTPYDPTKIGGDLIKQIVNASEGDDILIYYHNARFDANFLWGAITNIQTIESGGSLYQVKGVCHVKAGRGGKPRKANITVHDTMAFLQCKLAAFHGMFKLDVAKQADFPYDLFTLGRMSMSRLKSSTLPEEAGSLIPEKYHKNGWVSLYAYAFDYCELDCRVLQQGFDRFREASLELGLDVDDYLSAASFAKGYMQMKGAMDGVLPLAGSCRAYVQESVVGGRVCIRGNKPLEYESVGPDDKLVDFDAVSLYPSAMASIPGYPKGAPVRFTGPPPANDNFYVATVRLAGLRRELHFSTLSLRDENGRRWGKGAVPLGSTLVLNRVQVESAVKHQGAEFEFVGGYTWPDGWNTSICSIIKDLFAWRLRLKKEGNPLQATVKLIMNSAYGKLVERPHDDRVRWIWATRKDAIHQAVQAGIGFDYLAEVGAANGPGKQLFKLKYSAPDFHHVNYAHAGGLVLAQSKEIMYQVTTPLDDDICYTDTDSMILPEAALEKLNRPDLVGKKMGQFHSDLVWPGKAPEGEVAGQRGIFVGKKCYALELAHTGLPDQKEYHIRMKGVGSGVVKATAKRLGLTIFKLYQTVRDRGVDFNLLECNVRFKQGPTSIRKVSEFHRRLGPY